ncbi:MAG: sigma-70 family RNA polymerase sigma factor [Vicinamibacteraceae bacterium]
MQESGAMPESDAAVISRVRAGDDDAFRELVERHGRAVFRVAFRVTGRVEDAEDVVQETFLRAYRQLNRFEARSNVRTWLHRIATNCAIDLLRARPKREVAEEPETLERAAAASGDDRPSPERSVLGVQIGERLAGAMALLTEMERATFTLRHFEGLSIDEIGGKLGLKTNATKHSIFRAVRKMRRELQAFIEV